MSQYPEDVADGKEDRLARIEKYRQIGRTVRTTAICAVIAISVWRICDAAVVIMDKPPWLAFILAIVAPGGVFYLIIRGIRSYTRRTARRTQELEKLADPRRTSSGLMEDGRTPPDEKP